MVGGRVGTAGDRPTTRWVEVRLAQRPNESMAWVPSADLSLATDPYHILVDLGTTHLQLFKEGRQVGRFPAGIGVPSVPTPTGQFFVALFAQPPSPAYGQFVIATSAHSNVISDWEESGDAITAIHGPQGADAAIGTRQESRRLHPSPRRRSDPTPSCARRHSHRYGRIKNGFLDEPPVAIAHVKAIRDVQCRPPPHPREHLPQYPVNFRAPPTPPSGPGYCPRASPSVRHRCRWGKPGRCRAPA